MSQEEDNIDRGKLSQPYGTNDPVSDPAGNSINKVTIPFIDTSDQINITDDECEC